MMGLNHCFEKMYLTKWTLARISEGEPGVYQAMLRVHSDWIGDTNGLEKGSNGGAFWRHLVLAARTGMWVR